MSIWINQDWVWPTPFPDKKFHKTLIVKISQLFNQSVWSNY